MHPYFIYSSVEVIFQRRMMGKESAAPSYCASSGSGRGIVSVRWRVRSILILRSRFFMRIQLLRSYRIDSKKKKKAEGM